MERGGCVYIMTNQNNSVFYIGVTSDIYTRVYEHKYQLNPDSFTSKYNCDKLVWYRFFPRIEEAISVEKAMKNWRRDWKIQLITEVNKEFNDLFNSLK